MMRKLAVTVFAFSLSALGCGSDSGTKATPDTAVAIDAGKTDVVSPDAQVADAPNGPEAQVVLDAAKLDLPAVDQAQVIDQALVTDQAQVIDQAKAIDQAPPAIDTAKSVDTQGIDGPKPVLDGGVDIRVVDSGATVDSGSVDGGSAG